MAEAPRYPKGAYIAVRGLPDGWAAVVAVRGSVLHRATFLTRPEAFEAAEAAAERTGLPSLIKRVAA
jgi:hypothetical protein